MIETVRDKFDMSSGRSFLDDNFLLENQVAEQLYHDYAQAMPIIDYHCHLPPEQLAKDHNFGNLTKIWLDGDHYKWRAMRTLGIGEEFITGDAPDQEKFRKWAETVPFTIRNPLFHWTHLELRRYFKVNDILNATSADAVYRQCSDLLQQPEFSSQGLVRKMNVKVICTTDDPVDDLEYHRIMEGQEKGFRVFPAFRPDKAILIEDPGFTGYLDKLANVSGVSINKFDDLLQALQNRIEFFHANNCKLSDHGLNFISFVEPGKVDINKVLSKRMEGIELNTLELDAYKSAVLIALGKMYAEKGWVMQLHLGALRNNNRRMARKLGSDTGFDSIGDWHQAGSLSKFLDKLDDDNTLPKTIVYNLNPSDNELIATMMGNFNDGSTRGKMQFGSAWWFLDQKNGIEKQIDALSDMGLLSCFIGMLTDSRSFLSYPRHEYFRRLLCTIIGRDVVNGELPYDLDWLGGIVQDICYNNARSYFKFV